VHLLCDVAGKIAAGDFTLDREDLAVVVRLGSEAATSAHLCCTGLMQRAAEAHLAEPEAIAALLDGAGIVAGTVATLAAPV
jgi:hypothetical protein